MAAGRWCGRKRPPSAPRWPKTSHPAHEAYARSRRIRSCRHDGRPFPRWLRVAGAKAVDVPIWSPEVQPRPDIVRLWLAEDLGPAAGYFGTRFIKVVNFEKRNDLRVVVPAEIEIAMPLAEQLNLVTVLGGQRIIAHHLERQLQAQGPGKEPDRIRVLFGRYAQPDQSSDLHDIHPRATRAGPDHSLSARPILQGLTGRPLSLSGPGGRTRCAAATAQSRSTHRHCASLSPTLRQASIPRRVARSVSPRRRTGRPDPSSTWTRPLTTPTNSVPLWVKGASTVADRGIETR